MCLPLGLRKGVMDGEEGENEELGAWMRASEDGACLVDGREGNNKINI